MTNKPADQGLYDKVKARVYKSIPKHSAYRSGVLVKEYKEAFRRKHGNNKQPYVGEKDTNGLTRWFKEEWRNESGGVGYDKNNTLYRPTKRVTADTPKTWNEIPKSRVQTAKEEEKAKARVKKF